MRTKTCDTTLKVSLPNVLTINTAFIPLFISLFRLIQRLLKTNSRGKLGRFESLKFRDFITQPQAEVMKIESDKKKTDSILFPTFSEFLLKLVLVIF